MVKSKYETGVLPKLGLVEAWAREGLAFCYQEGILDDSAMEIQGKTEILRCEIAQMLYNLLSSAKLL